MEMFGKATVSQAVAIISTLLKAEGMVCETVEKLVTPSPMSHPHGGKNPLSQGTVQLIGDICNRSEMRQYKMKKRLE